MKHVKKFMLIALCIILSFIHVVPCNAAESGVIAYSEDVVWEVPAWYFGVDYVEDGIHYTWHDCLDYVAPKPVKDPNNHIVLSDADRKAAAAIFKPEYFEDACFYQLNLNVIPEEVYQLDEFNREVTFTDEHLDYDYDTTHIAKAYIAPVLMNGKTYMSLYDITCVYSNDELTEAFMNLMASNRTLRDDIMTLPEYYALKKAYADYKDSTYDVNPYVYHYIVELMDLVFGEKLFDFDFYCETYPALALLYDYNEAALKQHFYSIGLYEGRQGCAHFNVNRYTDADFDLGTYFVKYAVSDSDDTYPWSKGYRYQIRLYDPDFYAYAADVSLDHKNSSFIEDLPCAYVQGEANALACYRARFQLMCNASQDEVGTDFCKDVLIPMYGKFRGDENYCSSGISSLHTDELLMDNSYVIHDAMQKWRPYRNKNKYDRDRVRYDKAVNDRYVYCGVGHVYIRYNPDSEEIYSAQEFFLYYDEMAGFALWAADKLKY